MLLERYITLHNNLHLISCFIIFRLHCEGSPGTKVFTQIKQGVSNVLNISQKNKLMMGGDGSFRQCETALSLKPSTFTFNFNCLATLFHLFEWLFHSKIAAHLLTTASVENCVLLRKRRCNDTLSLHPFHATMRILSKPTFSISLTWSKAVTISCHDSNPDSLCISVIHLSVLVM